MVILGLYIRFEHLAVALAFARDVEPAGALGVLLKEQLVETAVFKDELGIELAGGFVGQADVGCFACLVLGVGYASYQLVELGASIAGVDDYWLA